MHSCWRRRKPSTPSPLAHSGPSRSDTSISLRHRLIRHSDALVVVQGKGTTTRPAVWARSQLRLEPESFIK
jgi:hypothetical protein